MCTVTLIDGREVDSESEEWRHECEARYIALRPTLVERRQYLEAVERKRGFEAANELRATMKLLWNER